MGKPDAAYGRDLVSGPEVIYRRDDAGALLEPYETASAGNNSTLYVDVPNENPGDILQSLAARKADIIHMEHQSHTVTVQAVIPTRGLIGFETDLVNCTKGHGIMSHLFKYGPHKGDIENLPCCRLPGGRFLILQNSSTRPALNRRPRGAGFPTKCISTEERRTAKRAGDGPRSVRQ